MDWSENVTLKSCKIHAVRLTCHRNEAFFPVLGLILSLSLCLILKLWNRSSLEQWYLPYRPGNSNLHASYMVL